MYKRIWIWFLLLNYLKHGIMSTEPGTKEECNKDLKGCEDPAQHIFCLVESSVSKCDEYSDTATNDDFRKKILEFHNKFRDEWAAGTFDKQYPQVADMNQLTYDCELEKIAKRHMIGCLTSSESCRILDRFSYEQNIATTPSHPTPGDVPSSTDEETWGKQWRSTYEHLPPLVIKNSLYSSEAANFMRMVWSSTRLIGCAEAFQKHNGLYHRKVVCNYAPLGDMKTTKEKMLNFGPPCSSCPSGRSCNPSSAYPNLCAANSTSEEDKPFSGSCVTSGAITTQRRDLLITISGMLTMSTTFWTWIH